MKTKIKQSITGAVKKMPDFIQDTVIGWHLANKKKNLSSLKTPTSVILYVTDRCNLRCNHCFYWNSLNKKTYELTIDDFSKIAASLAHPITLSITGGEPFLRKDLDEIVKVFIGSGKVKEVGIASNGFLTDEVSAFCERFRSTYKDIPLSVQISLDGTEQTHDSIRKVKGSFNRALETIGRLKKLEETVDKFSVSAGIAVQKKNASQVPELLDLLGPMGVKVRINLIRGESLGTFGVSTADSSHNEPQEGKDISLNSEEIRTLYDVLCQKDAAYGFFTKKHKRIFEVCMEVLEKKKKVVNCFAGTIDSVIYANGDVAFCELTKPVGNLRDFDFDLQKLWCSKNAEAMRPKVERCFCIHGCNISTSLMFQKDIVKESLLGK